MADRLGRFGIGMHQIRLSGNDDISFFPDCGRRAEEIFQHRDLDQKRDADSLFDVLLADIARQQFFGFETEREFARKRAGIAQFVATVAFFRDGFGGELVSEDHAAVVFGVKSFRGRDLSVGLDLIRSGSEADHRIEDIQCERAVAAFHDRNCFLISLIVDGHLLDDCDLYSRTPPLIQRVAFL